MNSKLLLAPLALGLTFAMSGCDSDSSPSAPHMHNPPAPTTAPKTILEIAAADTSFETLAAAVTAAGLASTLADTTKQFTVFAPTDAAFAKLPAGTVAELLKDPTGDLKDILLYHVVAAKVESPTVVTLSKATTVNGKDVTVEVRGGKVYLNGTTMVTVVDIQAKNGVIHVIDAVLLPPAPEAPAPKTILEIAAADTSFETLAAAVTAAGLASTLADTTKQFTVFAPTDAAFAKLPAGTVAELLKDPTGDLKDILLYHVVAAKVESPTVVTLSKATTVNGKDVTIEVRGGKVYLNGTSMVTVVDIQARNGVIHVIDAVLLP